MVTGQGDISFRFSGPDGLVGEQTCDTNRLVMQFGEEPMNNEQCGADRSCCPSEALC